LLDKYFEAKHNRYKALIEMSHNTLLKEGCIQMASENVGLEDNKVGDHELKKVENE
jgi:hypothetical protein